MKKPEIKLIEGEQIVIQIEADLWSVNSNPIMMFLGKIIRIINMILGYRINGFITITNKRVIETREEIKLYCFPSDRSTKIVVPSSVKEVGYKRMATWFGCLCPVYFLYYEGFTQSTLIQLKGSSDDQAMDYANKFYSAIVSK